MRRRTVVYGVILACMALWLAACASSFAPSPLPTTPATAIVPAPAPTSTSDLGAHKNALGGFPFPAGTTWVYSEQEYQQVIGDPTSIITATRLFTDAVAPEQISPRTAMFVLERTVSEVSTPPGWSGSFVLDPGQSWYRIEGNQIFSVISPGGQKGTLLYDFPLVVGKSWCPHLTLPDNLPSCRMNGLRTVQSRTSYTTPVGTFDDCYEINEEYNSGGIREWFCNGIGTVARKYDHSGTRFGFQDTLIKYSRGSDR